MDEKTYNGWVNYATYVVAQWIDNEASCCREWRDEARRHREESLTCQEVLTGASNAEQAAMTNLANQLRDDFFVGAPPEERTVYSDLLHAAIGEVEWLEIAEHLLASLKDDEHPIFGPVIFAYTRAQAIADGVLVDVTEMAREAGLKYPTAVTAAVWAEYVAVPDGVEAQDEQGRLWDILMMLRFAIQKGAEGSQLLYEVLVRNDNKKPRPVKLKSICGPGDTADPVLTILLPHED